MLIKKNKVKISATIVLYKEDETTLKKTISSFLKLPISKKLFLIDNSPTSKLKSIVDSDEVEYFHMKKNIGFGKGHNQVLNKIKDLSDFHLVLNPDVYFSGNVINELISKLEEKTSYAMIAPKVVFPSNKHQFTARKYPSFFDLIIRRLNFFKSRLHEQEYRSKNLTKPLTVEYLTGCFQLYKTKGFISLKGFDERYFLYMEDVDICKKMDVLDMKKLYYPQVQITHVLKKGSSKNLKLFFYHLISAIKYFLKWGFK